MPDLPFAAIAGASTDVDMWSPSMISPLVPAPPRHRAAVGTVGTVGAVGAADAVDTGADHIPKVGGSGAGAGVAGGGGGGGVTVEATGADGTSAVGGRRLDFDSVTGN